MLSIGASTVITLAIGFGFDTDVNARRDDVDDVTGDIAPGDLATKQKAVSGSLVLPPVLDNAKCSAGTYIFSDLEGQDMRTMPELMKAFEQKVEYVDEADGVFPGKRGQGIKYLPLKLKANTCLVFLGDVLDSAGHNGRVHTMRGTMTLIYLKTKFPDQVVLILGNRDVNKMRLKSELLLPMTRTGPYYWLAGKTAKGLDVEQPTKGQKKVSDELAILEGPSEEKLKYILGSSMGAGATFDNIGKELAKSGQEVADFFLQSVTEGVMEWYIELAHVIGAAKLDDGKYAIFVHGSLHPAILEANGDMKVPTAEFNHLTGEYTGEGLPLDLDSTPSQRASVSLDQTYATLPEAGVDKWVEAWAKWKQGIYDEWKKVTTKDEFDEHQVAAANPSKFVSATRPGTSLMDMGLGTLGGTFRNAGFWQATPIVEFRLGQNPEMLGGSQDVGGAVTSKDFGERLSDKFNITRLFAGHFCESGKIIPEIFGVGSKGFHSVNLDVTFSGETVNRFSDFAKDKDTKDMQMVSDFSTVLSKDGKVEIAGTLQGVDGHTEYSASCAADSVQIPTSLGSVMPVATPDAVENWRLISGRTTSDGTALWNFGPHKDKMGTLKAYTVAQSGDSLIKKVNHQMVAGFPPGATWYYLSAGEAVKKTH